METARLFLHVLAATVWVGGQIVLAAAVPVLRGVDAEAPRAAARAYGRVAWPAFGVLVLTGIWNVAATDGRAGSHGVTLVLKLAAVVASGITAFLHTRATSPRARGAFGAASGVSAILALLLGIILAE
jgi:putative copper export protein